MSVGGRRLVDVSHVIEHGMVTYHGLPVPVISDWLSRDASRTRYAAGTTFHVGKVEMLANTGTYIDTPFHRYEGGEDIADYPLEAVADLDGIVIRATARPGRALDASWFRSRDVKRKAVLVHTGWDAHWRTERYGAGHPSSPMTPPRILSPPEQRSWASIPSTWTTTKTVHAPRTRCYSGRGSRLSSTGAT
ncbi:MAG TPA: cyclase family protein [Gemmatimonadales bacterium]|nr:cyclase family protein [Gemmatimonadales bacterium]